MKKSKLEKVRITKVYIQNITPPESGERVHWDDKTRGFGVRVLASGSMSFIFHRRLQNGTAVKATLGRVGEIKVEPARRQAEELLGQIATGKDPVGDRRRARANKFGALADEYIKRRCPSMDSRNEVERIIHKDLLPRWGQIPSANITRRMVRELGYEIKDRGAPIQANRTISLVKRIFNFGIDEELVSHNPAARMKPVTKEKRRQRALTDDEIRTVWMKVPEMKQAGLLTQTALKLILVTAQRPGEVLSMEWGEIDGNWWTIPPEKSKNDLAHRVPLSPLALELLAALPRQVRDSRTSTVTGQHGYVFPRKVGRGYSGDAPMNSKTLPHAVRLNNDLFNIEHWTPHDLRRTAASHMAGMGVSRTTIGKILNHAEPGVTAIYDRHGYDAEKRAALDAWSEKLGQIIDGRQAEITRLVR